MCMYTCVRMRLFAHACASELLASAWESESFNLFRVDCHKPGGCVSLMQITSPHTWLQPQLPKRCHALVSRA